MITNFPGGATATTVYVLEIRSKHPDASWDRWSTHETLDEATHAKDQFTTKTPHYTARIVLQTTTREVIES